MDKEWRILQADKAIVNNLSKQLKVSKIIAHLLVLRGIKNYQDAKLFFRPKLHRNREDLLFFADEHPKNGKAGFHRQKGGGQRGDRGQTVGRIHRCR